MAKSYQPDELATRVFSLTAGGIFVVVALSVLIIWL